jgi:hypothetical protein
MITFASMRPLLFGAGLFAAGLAAHAALVAKPVRPQASIRAGATLAGFMPDDVMALSWATSWGMTTAQRSAAGAAFQMLSTFADGRAAQHCIASPDMAGRLAELSVVTARRALSPAQREREFPALLGVMEIRDAAISESGGPVLVFTTRDRTAVAAVRDGRAAEVTLPAAELRWLETACAQAPAAQAQKKLAAARPAKRRR